MLQKTFGMEKIMDKKGVSPFPGKISFSQSSESFRRGDHCVSEIFWSWKSFGY